MRYGQTEKRKIQTMRIFRGLENIQAAIDRHESEWRKEQGEELTERHPRISLEEAVRRRIAEQPVTEGSGKFSADRFLGGNTKPVKHEPEAERIPEPEAVSIEPEKPESSVRHSWLYNEVMKAVNHASAGKNDAKIIAVFIPVAQEGAEAREIPNDDAEFSGDGGNVQAVEIIRHKDGKHSRLYDEVMRAVNDSAEDGRKIVAVFVPLLQDGKEFEDLPADETVTLSAVSGDAVKIETAPENEPESVLEDLPAVTAPEDAEIPALIPAAIETEPEPEIPEDITEPEPEIFAQPAPETESEPVPEVSAEFDLIPEMKEPDPVVIEALQEIEEKLDGETENPADESEPAIPEPETLPEISESETDTQAPGIFPEESEPEAEIAPPEPETETESQEPETEYDDVNDVLQDGEPMTFENIETIGNDEPEQEEITLPAELEDDEILDGGEFDESLTEIHTADDEDDTIILEGDDDGEIELLPDPVKQ